MLDLARVDERIDQHVSESVAELTRFCAQPSISATGDGIREAANMLLAMLERRGLVGRIMETSGMPVVYAEGGRGDRTLLLYNHYDVQPPEPLELWNTAPFEPEIRDGRLFGRGVADDKGDIVCRLAAIDAILHVYGDLPCRLKFCIEGEEEIGSVHLGEFVQSHVDLLAADACLWEGGGVDFKEQPLMMLGMRGMLYVELQLRTLHHDGHSGAAHLYPNAAWRLIWALNSLKDRNERILIPGFYDDVRDPSALDLRLLRDHLDPEVDRLSMEMMGIEQFLGNREGIDAARQVFLPTCNVAGIVAGHTGIGPKTIVPAHATAKVDFRLVPDQDPEDLERKLRAHLDRSGFGDIELTVLGGESPARTPPDNPYVQMCADTAHEVYGKPAKILPLVGGTGPIAAFIEHLGVPVLTAGCGSPGSMAHAPNENMRLDAFALGAKHIARLMLHMPTVLGSHRASGAE